MRSYLGIHLVRGDLLRNKAAHNMGFSAMLAEEYVLIVPFAYRLHHGATFLRNIN
jgi:hypothetical protein